MTAPRHVPPTLEGRVMVELGATLAKVRREYDAALDRIDVLERQLAEAHAALAAHARPLPALQSDERQPDAPMWRPPSARVSDALADRCPD